MKRRKLIIIIETLTDASIKSLLRMKGRAALIGSIDVPIEQIQVNVIQPAQSSGNKERR
jgi:hypothetical protein